MTGVDHVALGNAASADLLAGTASVIHHPMILIISDPTVPEISSTYVTDLATDGSAELDPDGLPTPSSATDTISLLAIPVVDVACEIQYRRSIAI